MRSFLISLIVVAIVTPGFWLAITAPPHVTVMTVAEFQQTY